jgi:hypothetical protein
MAHELTTVAKWAVNRAHQMDAGMAEAGQSCDEPLHEEEEGRPHQDVWHRLDLWGSAPYRWDVDLDDQDATQVAWTISGACGSVLGFL